MLKQMTTGKLLALLIATIIATVLLAGTVIVDEPPAFIAFGFGFLNGANWIGLIKIAMDFWEGES